MSKILPLIIVLIAVGASGFAAMTLRGGGEASTGDSATAKGKNGEIHTVEGETGVDPSQFNYFQFQRNFIVPVTNERTIGSILLLNLSVEIKTSDVEQFRPREPRIRDNFMRTLLGLSHEGYFNGDITAPGVYDEIQNRLTATARASMDDDVNNVLIIDFARQNQ
ncbi:MAG: flagellar basal body-associated FliL family protein [Pseudomonadota bacterium]